MMSATVMSYPTQPPHRKPVPTNIPPDLQYQPRQSSLSHYADQYTRPRTSSNSPPVHGGPTQQPPNQQRVPYHQSSGRTFSTATASTVDTLHRAPTNSSMPRRSTSSRSNGSSGSPTSYVALMRKQKATVWCDRAQHEDPKILAQHRAAKMRAAMQVAGGKHHGNRVSTSSSHQGGTVGIRSKIRHQGAPKVGTYTGGANMSGAGVPIRLSATEVDENDSGDDFDSRHAKHNQRTGSGRSSLGSGPRTSGNSNVDQSRSNGSTPPTTAHSPSDSMGYIHQDRTPVPNHTNMNQSDYFEQAGNEADEEHKFGGIGRLPPSQPKTERDFKLEEDLKRRGSVDDRAMTMSGQRLFVANPDLSD